jgi:hypothetical protein
MRSPVNVPPKIHEYQVTRENDGTPIGPKSRYVYVSVAELIEKLQAAHVNAVRLADRLARKLDAQTKAQRKSSEFGYSAVEDKWVSPKAHE